METRPLPDEDARRAALLARFDEWRRQNQSGGWPTRWRRRPTWLAQLAQRVGLRRTVTAPLFFGGRMRVVTNEEVSRGILTFGYAEAAITALYLRVLRPGDVVVDVGTHFGYEAALASHLVGPHGRVFAFEPHPDAAAIAAENLLRLGNVELHYAAVGDRPGRLRFARTPLTRSAFAGAAGGTLRPTAGAPEIEVELTTLDDVVGLGGARVRMVKVDVEGAEAAVLRGAAELIARDHPMLVLEADTHADAEALAALLAAEAYRAYDFDDDDGQFRAGPLGSLRRGHANVLFAAGADTELVARIAAP